VRVSEYEEGYLEGVFENGGGGGLGKWELEPGAGLALCQAKRLSLKSYTPDGVKKVADGGGAFLPSFLPGSVPPKHTPPPFYHQHRHSDNTPTTATATTPPLPPPPAAAAAAAAAKPRGSMLHALKSSYFQALQSPLPTLPPLPPPLYPPPPGSCISKRRSRRNHFHPHHPHPHCGLTPGHIFDAATILLPLSFIPVPTTTGRSADGSLALSRSAHAASMSLCDLAIVQALAGESCGREEAALAGLCARGGLAHRGFFRAMGRRMVGRGSNRGVDPRLSTLTTRNIISLLQALCLAWEFDEDAFSMGIGELQRRVDAGGIEVALASPGGEGGWKAEEVPMGVGVEEDMDSWGKGGAAAWKKKRPFSSLLAPATNSPSPDFLWDRGSSSDWASIPTTTSTGEAWEVEPPLDTQACRQLHDVLITLGTLAPFPALVWEVPKPLRLAALSVSPFYNPGQAEAAAEGAVAPFYPPPAPLAQLADHCIRVLRASLTPGGPLLAAAAAAAHPPPTPRQEIPRLLSWLFDGKHALGSEAGAERRRKRRIPPPPPRPGPAACGMPPTLVSEAPCDAARLTQRASTFLDLLTHPEIVAALREEGLSQPGEVGEALVAPTYAAQCGVVCHVALPYHRVAIELVGPGGAVAACAYPHPPPTPTPPHPPSLSLHTMWKASILRASGWTVIFMPVPPLASDWSVACVESAATIRGGGSLALKATLNPLNSVAALSKYASVLRASGGL